MAPARRRWSEPLPLLRIALCRVPPGAEARLPALLARLPPAQRAEVARSRRAADRLARAGARLLLQALLAEWGLDLSGWRREASGRPFLEGRPVDLSLSHSGDWVAVAVGRDLRLGLDVERARALDPADFAGLLTPAEQRAVVAAADPSALLLRLWCGREAVLKAGGGGLGAGAAAFRAIGEGRHPDGCHWHLQQAWLPEGCLALATDRPVPLRWEWREWPG